METQEMFDVVFISFDELNADENWDHLKNFVPCAHRIHNVKGIANAHIEAAKMVSTDHFFTVDGDNWIYPNFNWDKVIDFQKNDQRIHVWGCKNSVNGLKYGYGGIKLWPTNHVENIKQHSVDFTTSVATRGFRVHEQIASTTIFNTSEFNTWRSAFRECVKLSGNLIGNHDERTKNRLQVWMSIGVDSEYGYYSLQGARAGAIFAMENQTDDLELAKINDFDWLWEKFNLESNHIDDERLRKELKSFRFEFQDFSKEQSIWFKKVMYGL